MQSTPDQSGNPYYGDTYEAYLWRLGYSGLPVPDYQQDMALPAYKEGIQAGGNLSR